MTGSQNILDHSILTDMTALQIARWLWKSDTRAEVEVDLERWLDTLELRSRDLPSSFIHTTFLSAQEESHFFSELPITVNSPAGFGAAREFLFRAHTTPLRR